MHESFSLFILSRRRSSPEKGVNASSKSAILGRKTTEGGGFAGAAGNCIPAFVISKGYHCVECFMSWNLKMRMSLLIVPLSSSLISITEDASDFILVRKSSVSLVGVAKRTRLTFWSCSFLVRASVNFMIFLSSMPTINTVRESTTTKERGRLLVLIACVRLIFNSVGSATSPISTTSNWLFFM